MRGILSVALALVWVLPAGAQSKQVLEGKTTDIGGKVVNLADYKGKVVLIVNVASQCGYTDQYKGLQALYAKYGKEGLVVLGFPCNDFGNQEPDGEKAIAQFCTKNYGVTFPMFSKIAIAGNQPHPLYKALMSKESNPKFAGPVRWNFEKFLLGRDGVVIARFESDAAPEDCEKAIKGALGR